MEQEIAVQENLSSKNFEKLQQEVDQFTPVVASRYLTSVEEIKKCPKCSSIFCTDKECEVCGLQFGHDFLGEAFGAKSFYQFHHDYYQSTWPKFKRFFKSKDFRRYQRQLLKRFSDLVFYFYKDYAEFDQELLKKDFYYLEFLELVDELQQMKVNKSSLYHILESESDQFKNFYRPTDYVLSSPKAVKASIYTHLVRQVSLPRDAYGDFSFFNQARLLRLCFYIFSSWLLVWTSLSFLFMD